MKTKSLPYPSRREALMAVGILLCVLGAVGIGAYQFLWLTHQTLNDELERLPVLYQKALKLQSRREVLEQELELSQQALANNDTLLLPQSTENLAQAALQEQVKTLIERNNSEDLRCYTRQQKNMPIVKEGNYQRVSINVNFDCNLLSLQTVLYDLESSTPVLLLNDLSIRTRNDILNVSFDISGYIRSPGPSKRESRGGRG